MFANLKNTLNSVLPRMSGWFVIVLLLMVAVWLIAPHQLSVALYKLSLVTLAAVVGYWLDRSLFPYARPHEFLNSGTENTLRSGDSECNSLACWFMIRRAVIIGAAMIAVSLGA